jgi:hypothetical protein
MNGHEQLPPPCRIDAVVSRRFNGLQLWEINHTGKLGWAFGGNPVYRLEDLHKKRRPHLWDGT